MTLFDKGHLAMESEELSAETASYQCSHCQRRFARIDHLTRHVRTRESSEPFVEWRYTIPALIYVEHRHQGEAAPLSDVFEVLC
jgi:hypothetical protein